LSPIQYFFQVVEGFKSFLDEDLGGLFGFEVLTLVYFHRYFHETV